MADPFLAEIRLLSFNFAPQGWALCNGQLLPINQNQALFSLLGTVYGGNGQTNFGLPDLRGRTPISFGGGHNLGEVAGAQAVTLTTSQLPLHFHVAQAFNANGDQPVATANVLGTVNNMYNAPGGALVALAGIGNTGGSQAHLNMQPFLVLNFAIALIGIFPSQN